MAASAPTVSILLPVYNGSAYLRQTFESIRAQTFDDWEVLIGDNASSDDTPEIVAGLKTLEKVRAWRHEENLGAGGNIGFLANAARGQFLCILSHDDLLAPNYFDETLAAARSTLAGLVMPDFAEIDERGEPLPRTHIDAWRPLIFQGETNCPTPGALLGEIAARKSLPFSVTSLIRAEAFRRAGGYSSDYLLACDASFHLRLLLQGAKVCFLNKKLFHYRRHSQMSSVRDTPRNELQDELHFLFAEHAPALAEHVRGGKAAFGWRQYRSALKRLLASTIRREPGRGRHWVNFARSLQTFAIGKRRYGG